MQKHKTESKLEYSPFWKGDETELAKELVSPKVKVRRISSAILHANAVASKKQWNKMKNVLEGQIS